MESNELKQTIFEALKGASEACESLSGFALQAGNHLRAGEIQEGNEMLLGILDDFSQLVSLVTDVSLCSEFAEQVEASTLNDLGEESQQTTDLLKMALEAQENQDWVFLADILEYEFAEKLGSWTGLLGGLAGCNETSISP
jgi:hypothetical protein